MKKYGHTYCKLRNEQAPVKVDHWCDMPAGQESELALLVQQHAEALREVTKRSDTMARQQTLNEVRTASSAPALFERFVRRVVYPLNSNFASSTSKCAVLKVARPAHAYRNRMQDLHPCCKPEHGNVAFSCVA